ncbi:MAG TPA: FAD-dependent oxidoreductase [Acidimicrobiales bacterium]|nr:FAD-dependent oxidoreductase [Acidimicrobiales bacterium]
MAFDLVVVGGGAAGLGAAREGTRRGARVLLVQQGEIGGDCTFTGCVPSKALLAAAASGASFAEARERVARAVERVAANESDDVIQGEGIEVRHGFATFRSPTEIDLDGVRVEAPRIVLATGAGPVVPPIPGLADVDPLTNETVFGLERRPERLAVLGGGPIGVELGQAFARLGTKVTIVEALDRLLAKEEPEASEVVTAALVHDGVDVRVGRRLERVTPNGSGATLVLDDGSAVEVDRVLVAVGRRAVTEGLALERAGVAVDERGYVGADDTMATSAPTVWAAGDVTGHLQLTHAANKMGMVAARNALTNRALAKVRPARFDAAAVPWATFTSPEVGRVGLTEAESVAQGGRVAYLPMAELDRAIATGETRGFVKLIAGPRRVGGRLGGGVLLGATAVAPCGGELVHEVALAMRSRMFVGRLAQTVHAYPTWSMAIQQAAAQFFFTVEGRTARPAVGP